MGIAIPGDVTSHGANAIPTHASDPNDNAEKYSAANPTKAIVDAPRPKAPATLRGAEGPFADLNHSMRFSHRHQGDRAMSIHRICHTRKAYFSTQALSF